MMFILYLFLGTYKNQAMLSSRFLLNFIILNLLCQLCSLLWNLLWKQLIWNGINLNQSINHEYRKSRYISVSIMIEMFMIILFWYLTVWTSWVPLQPTCVWRSSASPPWWRCLSCSWAPGPSGISYPGISQQSFLRNTNDPPRMPSRSSMMSMVMRAGSSLNTSAMKIRYGFNINLTFFVGTWKKMGILEIIHYHIAKLGYCKLSCDFDIKNVFVFLNLLMMFIFVSI